VVINMVEDAQQSEGVIELAIAKAFDLDHPMRHTHLNDPFGTEPQ